MSNLMAAMFEGNLFHINIALLINKSVQSLLFVGLYQIRQPFLLAY